MSWRGQRRNPDGTFGPGLGARPPSAASAPQPPPAQDTAPPGGRAVLSDTYARYRRAAAPGTGSAPPSPPPEIVELVEEIEAAADDIWVPDHSGEAGEDWVALSDIAHNPALAGNNCHAVTFEIFRTAVEDVGHDHPVGTAELVFDSGVHWAGTFGDAQGRRWVVDYTAHQFDSSLPVPYVALSGEWEKFVAGKIGDKFGDELRQANYSAG